MAEIFSKQRLREIASFDERDLALLGKSRGEHNRLGLGYQLVFVRVLNYFPQQSPLEIDKNLVNFASWQLDLDPAQIDNYTGNRFTISRHQELLLEYLGLLKFTNVALAKLENFIFEVAQKNDDREILKSQVRDFLQEQNTINPPNYILEKIIGGQIKKSREAIYAKICSLLRADDKVVLQNLLVIAEGEKYSPLYFIKQNSANPSADAVLALINKLENIENTGVLKIDISWLNANRKRILYNYANNCSAYRLANTEEQKCFSALVCFLHESYRDTTDQLIVMFGRLLHGINAKAENEIAKKMQKQGKVFRKSLGMVSFISEVLLDEKLDSEQKISQILAKYSEEELDDFCQESRPWLAGKYSHSFHSVIKRFSYLRQFAPQVLEKIELIQSHGKTSSSTDQALVLLKKINKNKARKIPEGAPLDFVPKNILSIVKPKGGKIDRQAWECALLLKVNDELRRGNFHARHSKRFTSIDDFFVADEIWQKHRKEFFHQANLPTTPNKMAEHFRKRHFDVFQHFFACADTNKFVKFNGDRLEFASDPSKQLSEQDEYDLQNLRNWLYNQIPKISITNLLIEVDNELHFTSHFQKQSHQNSRNPQEIRAILATILAHGCNIGLTTTPDLIDGVSYSELKRISDWQLTPETHRHALGDIVKSFSNLDITLNWGDGKSAASDGQRFAFGHKVLQRTFSTSFLDFALEFYSFVADNYAPFYSLPKECQDRDSGHLLDGLLYNESDMDIEELFTDHHGYTDINFTAFIMLGFQARPRIRGMKNTALYRIDKNFDYQQFTSIVSKPNRLINLSKITPHWDKMAQLFFSIKTGHITASTAMRRLVAIAPANDLARACLLFGRILKTEHILQYLTNPLLRAKTRQTLLKVEQLHALQRDTFYAYSGSIGARQIPTQHNACSCLTLITACIIYWQAKQMSLLLKKHSQKLIDDNINPALISHISPIAWSNVILYGQYNLNPNLIR